METEKKELTEENTPEQPHREQEAEPKPKRERKPKAEKKKQSRDSFWKVMSLKRKLYACLGIVLLVCLLILGIYISHQIRQNKDHDLKVLTVSTLEEIVQVSELNTFTAVYNGIAQVNDEKKPEKVDYYVSYEAQVKAGLDFSMIRFSIDDETKQIRAVMPPVKINETPVNMGSLQFIFYDKRANRSTVSQEAYKACVADVREESASESAILELARENAENVIRALTAPIVKEYDPSYELSIEWEAEQE